MLSKQKSDKHSPILLTGGHAATTAIAVIEEIRDRFPAADISWIGSKSAIAGSKVTTLEHKIYPSMGVKYFEITAGKLQTKFTRYTIPLLFMIPLGFFQSLGLIIKIRPRVILSFGGFASFPVVFWGFIFGIPVILHEQTVAAGRAAIISSYFAKKIALGREESRKYFPSQKTVVTGNPLMKEIKSIRTVDKPGGKRTILIMGGSRGSEFINEEVYKIKDRLSAKYNVIHITGERDHYKYKALNSGGYRVLAFVDPREIHKYYREADLIISRSGANTVSEILYLKRPAILIPLPRTFMDEQVKNARYAESMGTARVLTEPDVNPESLLGEINYVFENWQKITEKARRFISPDSNSSEKLVDLIMGYI